MNDSMRKITILHSNDMHGQFVGKQDEDGRTINSLAQIAGYISAAKKENPDTLYCNAGDAFQGSLIDSEFLGLSTMDILNLLDIDIFTIGNHELDYGISHMMLVDRCANFPIINANIQIRSNGRRLFRPFRVVDLNGLQVLFIGLLTQSVADQAKSEGLVGSYVRIEDSLKEIVRCREKVLEKGKDADLTILLTHIGYEDDLELAASLDPELGVDMIIGGHSHTYLKEPAVVNGIIVAQAGMENTHIGRFDLNFDEAAGKIDSWEWKLIPVDEEHCPEDKFVRAMVNTYVLDIDEKYGRIVTRLRRTLDNYGRSNPTELGQLFADAFADALGLDIMMLASSSMRCYSMDMTVTLQDLRQAYPYDGKIYKLMVKGERLEKMIRHMLRDEMLDEGKGDYFQTSKNLRIDYVRDTGELRMTYRGRKVKPDQEFCIGLQEFYYQNAEEGLGVTPEELEAECGLSTAAADAFEVLKDYMSHHENLGGSVDNRFRIHGIVQGKLYR